MSAPTANEVNVALHRLLNVEPCETACTHAIVGTWTALGMANVVGRSPFLAPKCPWCVGASGTTRRSAKAST